MLTEKPCQFETLSYSVPAVTLKVLASLDVRAAVQVELEPTGLNYVRAAMRRSSVADRELRMVRADGVAWRSDRKVWLAKKKIDDKYIYKNFKPADNDDLGVREAKDAATSWVASADIDGVEGEDDDGEFAYDEVDSQHASAGA